MGSLVFPPWRLVVIFTPKVPCSGIDPTQTNGTTTYLNHHHDNKTTRQWRARIFWSAAEGFGPGICRAHPLVVFPFFRLLAPSSFLPPPHNIVRQPFDTPAFRHTSSNWLYTTRIYDNFYTTSLYRLPVCIHSMAFNPSIH